MIAAFGRWTGKIGAAAAMGMAMLSMATAPVQAQIRSVDPNAAIDADLAPQGGTETVPVDPMPVDPTPVDPAPSTPYDTPPPAYPATPPPAASTTTTPAAPDASTSYQRDDVLGAAEGVFGQGAEGLAGLIENILKDQGEPNAYIAGREASGAFVVGLRYGSGTLNHKIEGQRDVYWTGPSVGFDVGGNASKVFVLVYNLYDSQDLFKRYPAVEGTAYVVGGFTATYLRRGNVVLIPIRLGVGWRLGINAGYMKFTEKSRILPF
ncbi:MAG: DUF1134 domain-containing protein [Sphingobium sp.]